MSRIAYDCTGGNAQWVHDNLPSPDVMFWYGTGSPSVAWNEAEKSLFPHSVMVEIDQGGAGSPIPDAQVRDVENGAWGPGAATDKNGWNVARPTIYCDRSTLPSVAADGWRGDVWLAWPGWAGEALPAYRGITIVAVQDAFDSNYDHTTILDATWPGAATPPSSAGGIGVTVNSRAADLEFVTTLTPDHVVIEYVPASKAGSLVLTRVSPVVPNRKYRVSLSYIPGGSGGTVSVYGIVSGKAHLIGTQNL